MGGGHMAGRAMVVMGKDYEDYLRDESRSIGTASYIIFPESEEEVREALLFAKEHELSVTVQGGRTGISGGAVPSGGLIINLSRMGKVMGLSYDEGTSTYLLTVQPGLILSVLREMLEQMEFDTSEWADADVRLLEEMKTADEWFFSPDPTETSATIGGMIACNASGARSYYYGPIRPYVHTLRVMTSSGDMIQLTRGSQRANGYAFSIKGESGEQYQGQLPTYLWNNIKNASGYYSKEGMDLIDLFIGSEGTLGILTQAEIRLIPAPESMWSMTAFFPNEQSAVDFVINARLIDLGSPKLVSLEYFDHHALNLLREQRLSSPAFSSLPEIPTSYHTAIYIEVHGSDDDVVGDAMMTLCQVMVDSGGNEDDTWIATNKREMEKLHLFRHATPEAVNLKIDERRRTNPSLTKLGTDMAVPDAHLKDVLALYHTSLDGSSLDWVMFGHIGDNHIHVNILPNNKEEYELGREFYREWAKQVITLGGTVSAEHGIGKLKVGMLKDMYGYDGIRSMQNIKTLFDPEWMLNPDSLFQKG
jgi:D-lactate dehydrogenase (cytochrome)